MIRTVFQTIASSLVVSASVHATAQDEPLDLPSGEVATQWIAMAGEAGSKDLVLEKWDVVEFATIRPARLFEVSERPREARGKKFPKRSIYYAPVEGHSGTLCEPMRALRSINVICLVDADGDGQFERFFKTEPKSEIFDYGKVGTIAMLKTPVSLTETAKPEDKVALELKFGFSGKRGGLFATARQSFTVCYKRWVPALIASGKFVDSCVPGIAFTEDQFPQSLDIFGRRVTLNGVAEKTASVTIVTPEGDVTY